MKGIFWILLAAGFAFLSWPTEANAQTMDIKEFVHQTFIHGVPYDEASQYGSDVVPTLLKMLADDSEQEHWANIAVTLCIIGDEQALDPIIAFIDKSVEGQISPAHYRAKTSAIMALGYMINKTGSEKALNYLKSSLNTGAWEERKANWSSPFQASKAQRDMQLSTMAILGLALSGTEAAAEALHGMQQPAASSEAKAFQAQASDVVKEALSTLDMISREGLSEYYKKTTGELGAKE